MSGKCYASDYTSPTPIKLTTAVADGETAYTDASGRTTTTSTPEATYTNLKAGLIEGQTLTPGVYTWDRDVSFTAGITISGSSTDIFIFQTTGNVIVGSGAAVKLEGGALAKNIFWQVAGFVEAGTTSHLEGIFLVKTRAAFKTGSTLIGRIFAQTAVTLDAATITEP